MTLRVRTAHTDELVRVGDITAAAYTHDGHVGEDDDYVAHLRDAATREREAELYVALVDDVLAGTVTFCPEGSRWREIGRDGEGEFRMLAVAPEHRRQGVAEALVGLCLERSRELGYEAVVLSSLESQAPAQRIYQRLGFVRVPDRDWEPVPGVALMGFRAAL